MRSRKSAPCSMAASLRDRRMPSQTLRVMRWAHESMSNGEAWIDAGRLAVADRRHARERRRHGYPRGSTSDAARVQPAHVEDAGHPRHAWTEFSAGTAPSVADALCGRFSGVRLVHQGTRHPTAVDMPADDSRLAVEQCGPRPVPGLLQLSPEARVA